MAKPLISTECCWGSLDDGVRVKRIRDELGALKKYKIGFFPHALYESYVADLHRPQYGFVDTPGYMAFINMDGTLRSGHDVYNAFTDMDEPAIDNLPATNITTSSANLNGYLSSTGTSATAVWVYWGPTDSTTNADLWANTNFFGTNTVGATAYTANVTGLASNMTYYYNFYAQNASGGVWAAAGGSRSFATFGPLAVAIAGASGVGAGSATLNGRLVSQNADTMVLCWGTNDCGTGSTTNWPNVANFGAKTAGQSVSTNLTGLTYGIRYWYRVYATNAAGEAWSAPTNFVMAAAVSATGGTVTNYTDANGTNWTAHIFTNTAAATSIVFSVGGNVEVLVVAGGGGGGGGYVAINNGGGGGGGGCRTGFTNVAAGGISIVVGAGGSGGTSNSVGSNGSNSQFGAIVASGGGAGGGGGYYNALAGGCGGGAGFWGSVRGAGNTPATFPAQGFDGGTGSVAVVSPYYAGGGGGSAQAGNSSSVGTGGNGISSSIAGTTTNYGGGGGGGQATGPSLGGAGGGGNGARGSDTVTAPTAGQANSGGGGGGGVASTVVENVTGGKGGSGIVIVRYISPRPKGTVVMMR